MAAWRTAFRVHDPGLGFLRSAARAAIVMPAVFALADKVIGDPQLATFAAFGSFAMLVLVEFGGPVRMRLIAYVSLACVGAANIAIGTLCSRNPWLAAAAMALIGFVILFSGVINGYFAAAATAALLTFILAVMLPTPASALPARLEGWALAAAAGTAAQLLIWPQRTQASLRSAAARAAGALADLAASELARNAHTIADRLSNAGRTLRQLRAAFLAAPHKPSGPTGREAALNSLVDELDWVLAVLAPPAQPPALDVCADENARAVAAVVEALQATAATLEDSPERPDLDRLRETRRAAAQALVSDILTLPSDVDDEAIAQSLGSAFRVLRDQPRRRPPGLAPRRHRAASQEPCRGVCAQCRLRRCGRT
jgi:hypothetical protein